LAYSNDAALDSTTGVNGRKLRVCASIFASFGGQARPLFFSEFMRRNFGELIGPQADRQ